jgi:hypothetical protein
MRKKHPCQCEGSLLYYFIQAPGETGIVEGNLVRVKTSADRKQANEFAAAALLPIVVDILNPVFFIVPDKQARLDLAVLKPGKDLDAAIELFRRAVMVGFRDMAVPAGLGVEALLIHFESLVEIP